MIDQVLCFYAGEAEDIGAFMVLSVPQTVRARIGSSSALTPPAIACA